MPFHTRLLHLFGILALAVASANAAITPTQASITGLGNGIVGLVYPPQTGTSPNPNIKFFSNNTKASENKIWRATGVPPGLTFNPSGILSGKPSKAGNFTMNLSVRVGKQVRDTGSRTIVVVDTLPPIITPSTLPGGKLDNPYQANTPNNGFKLSGTGGTPFGPNSQYPTGYYWQLIPGKLASQRLPQGMTLNPNGVISGTPVWPRPPVSSTSQTYTLQVRATDFLGKSATANFTLVIAPPQGPEILTDCPLPSGLEKYPYPVVQLKARYGKEPYRWPKPAGLPPGLVWNERGYLSGTPTTRGPYPITLQVIDANGLSANKSCEIVIRPAPEIVVKPLFLCARVGDTRCEEIEALGGDPPFTWAATGLPPGLTIQSSNSTKAKICGNFTQNGTFTINVTATDTVGRKDTELFPAIIVKPALEITTTSPLPFGIKGNSYPRKTGTPTVTINATGGWPPYTWSWQNLLPEPPPGLTLNKSTGAITGVPTKIGNYTFTIRVQDSCTTPGKWVDRDFNIKVYDPLEIKDSQILQCLTINTTISPPFCLTATGGLPGYEWSIESGNLPAGLTLSSNGCITGTITEGGNFTVTIKVRDQNEIETTKSFSFFVYNELIITSACPLAFGTNGTAYSGNLAAIGGNPPYIWSVPTPSTLPLGLNINPNTGTISGTPKVTGNFTFNYRVADSCGNTATKNCSIRIFEPLKILDQSILSCLTTNRSVNPPFCLSASGGLAPYDWSIVSGSLPAGLSFSSNGCISGNITESGNFSVAIKVKDQNGTENQKTFSFTISNPLEITSACLPSEWTSGTPISPLTLSANGGSGNLTWSRHDIANKPWPAGLNIVGNKIQGTPIVSYTTNYTIAYQATDSCGNTANKTCNITIYPPLTCNQTLNLPCLYVEPNTLQLVADNDFAVFTGNSTNINRLIYQNNDVWTQQIVNAASLTFDLQSGENMYYILAMDGGGAASISGKVNGNNIAEIVANKPDKIKKSSNISNLLTNYNLSLLENGQYNATIIDAQNALGSLNSSDWSTPIYKSDAVIENNPYAFSQVLGGKKGLDFPVGGAVFFRVSASDLGTFPETVASTVSGGKAPYNWTILSANNSSNILPNGLNWRVSENGTQFILYGSIKESGTFPFIASVVDALGNTCSQNLTITVHPNLGITNLCPLPNGTTGVTYSENLTAVGGDQRYTWSLITPNNTLPPGLSLNSTSGRILGTPTTPGNYTFTYKVTDGCSKNATKNCTINIANPPCTLSISVTSTNPSSPNGTDGTATVACTGGVGPFRYMLSANGAVLSTSALIPSRSHTFAGLSFGVNYTVSINATGTAGCSAQQDFSLPESAIRFDADYVLLTYEFTDGQDLDTHSELLGMSNLPGGAPLPMGYSRTGGTAQPAANSFFFWGGDNTGTGLEAVYIDLVRLRQFHPTITEVAIDCRAHWYGTLGTRPVNMAARLFKGGAMVANGYSYINPTATNSSSLDSFADTITTDYHTSPSGQNPERVAIFVYNLITKTGRFLQNYTAAATVSNSSITTFQSMASLTDASQVSPGPRMLRVSRSGGVFQDPLLNQFSTNVMVGQNEITVGEYAEFLNAVARNDLKFVYNPLMSNIGISRITDNGHHWYSVSDGFQDHPIAYVSWHDAARYANWLANGKPSGSQVSTSTEDGAYNLGSSSIVRNFINPNTGGPPAYWLLNESEWYTSAYLNSDGSAIWIYPTQSNSAPDSSGTNPANFANFGGVFGETTPVGFFDQSPGPFGTFDQGGNVREWTETLDTSSGTPMRVIRGGSWVDPADSMRADESHVADPILEDDKTGFRIGGAP